MDYAPGAEVGDFPWIAYQVTHVTLTGGSNFNRRAEAVKGHAKPLPPSHTHTHMWLIIITQF